MPWTQLKISEVAQVIGSPLQQAGKSDGPGLWSAGAQNARTREAKIFRKSVLQHFQDLEDPRVERSQHHRLVSLVSIAILAALAEADSFVAIEQLCHGQASLARNFSGIFPKASRLTISLDG